MRRLRDAERGQPRPRLLLDHRLWAARTLRRLPRLRGSGRRQVRTDGALRRRAEARGASLRRRADGHRTRRRSPRSRASSARCWCGSRADAGKLIETSLLQGPDGLRHEQPGPHAAGAGRSPLRWRETSSAPTGRPRRSTTSPSWRGMGQWIQPANLDRPPLPRLHRHDWPRGHLPGGALQRRAAPACRGGSRGAARAHVAARAGARPATSGWSSSATPRTSPPSHSARP